jgi:4-amino-4-deoxy-L-arabinose transferase-like glycosyltransferase
MAEPAPDSPAATSRWQRLLTRYPLLVLALLVAAQTAFTLDARSLFYSDEVRHADVLRGVAEDGHWLRLTLNGEPYPDKPPLYFWMLAGLRAATPLEGEPLVFAGAALSVYGLAAATWALGRVALPRQEDALTAGLLLLGCLTVVALAHYARMDQMFAALITAAHACLLAGWRSARRFSGWVVAGGATAGLAALVKGPFAIGFVALASAGYLLYAGRARRLLRADVLLGVLLAAGIIGGWLAAAWRAAGSDYAEAIVFQQTFQRLTDSFRHAEPWWFYLPVLPALLLPWTPVLLVLPWRRVPGGGWRRSLRRGGPAARQTSAYLWMAAILGFVMLSTVSIKTPVYALPLLPPLLVLTAARLGNLSGRQRDVFWCAAAVVVASLAGAALAADRLVPLPVDVRGEWLLAGVLAAGGVTLWVLARRRPLVPALAAAVAAVAAGNVLAGVVGPSLEGGLSPRAQAERLAAFAEAGYAPLAYETYPGIYSYYAGRRIPDTWRRSHDDPSARPRKLRRYVREFLSAHDRAVIAMAEHDWREDWQALDLPGRLTVVHRQWLEDEWYLLVVWRRDTEQGTRNLEHGLPRRRPDGSGRRAEQPRVALAAAGGIVP